MTSVRQYEPYAAQLGFLSENIHRQLTERECGIFDRGLADYHRRKNVKAFVECLSLVLNTNHKRQLLIPIRDTYVKPSDTGRFNQLAQSHGLATSLKKKRREQIETEKGGEDKGKKNADGIHKVDVKRDANGEWGFNIRGGSDQGTGVFISWVEPESNSHKGGLMVGDQILKVNETSFENIKHHDAVQLIRGCKKLRLWLLSHGRVPTTRMAHKVYRWVDPDGRSTSPPPDPFAIAEKRAQGDYQFGGNADERKVTVMVDSGKELGISIRGGSEHGLGVYVSKVDEASVAEAYGIKVGDQILEVNGVSFLSIVHSDAARALRAQPCMVIKVKDVGKLPHSRITAYGETQWHKGKQREKEKGLRGKKAFQKGAGSQVMLKKYETAGTKSRGLMNEVARSVLTTKELTTFTYYINQYEQKGISVDDIATALLDLLDTPEKMQLLGEVRGIIRAVDLDRYNELTIHHEIAAKKAGRSKGGLGSVGGSQSRLISRDGSSVMASSSQPPATHHTIAEVHEDGPQALRSRLSPPAAADMSFSSGDHSLPFEEDVDFGGRDQIPQRLSPVNRKPQGPGAPIFHAPPPPPSSSSTSKPSTSTPDSGGQGGLTDGLKARRHRMRPGISEQLTLDEEDVRWDSQFSGAPSLSTIRSPHIEAGVSAVSLPEIEARIQQELEEKMKREFEEKERRLEEEHSQKLEREKREKEEQIRKEKEALERQLAEAEERTAREVEERVRREAEEEMRRQMEEKERAISQKMERLVAEQKAERESHRDEEKERLKMELEERIWKEAEEGMRQEFESRMQQEFEARMEQERQNLMQQTDELKAAALDEAEQKLRQQLDKKYQEEYEARLEEEKTKLKEKEKEEQRRMEAMERQRQQEEVERMEAEEQAKIDLEDKIRQEMEAAVRAEYEARLQFETEQRAKLAEEVSAHKALEQRLEQEREELEREKERALRERQERQEEEEEEEEMEERRVQEQKKREAAEKREREEREMAAKKKKEREDREREAARKKKEREERQRREQEAAERRRREEERKRGAKSERQRLEQERQRRVREEEEEMLRRMQEDSVGHTEEDEEAEKMLKAQRELAEQQQREEEEEARRQEEMERREREAAAAQKQSEAERKKELQRRREENIRRREEEQKRREEEQRLRLEGQKKQREEEERKRRQEEVDRAMNGKKSTRTQQIAVKFGDETEEAVQRRQRLRDKDRMNQHLVEEERRRAEQKLQKRVDKMKHQQQKQSAHSDSDTDGAPGSRGEKEGEGKSYGGYTDLHGEIVTVTVHKVCKKLGIAIDGGANTKQKAVIIREISPEGCAAKTASPPLRLGQQILQVENTSLYGLKHKDTVMAIKGAFEGPMNKTLTFVILDNPEENEETDSPQASQEPPPRMSSPEEPPTPEPTPQNPQVVVPEMQPAPAFQPQTRVQLRKKKRPPEIERRMREKGLDEFIAEASSDSPSHLQPPPSPSPQATGLSFGGYTNLRGEILTIPVTKVNKKLGMAIDGGANTKQVAITIRQITPDGSAALSGKGLKVGQQILQVNSKSLHGLSHSDVVSVIKSAFEGPIKKTSVTFIVLDPSE